MQRANAKCDVEEEKRFVTWGSSLHSNTAGGVKLYFVYNDNIFSGLSFAIDLYSIYTSHKLYYHTGILTGSIICC